MLKSLILNKTIFKGDVLKLLINVENAIVPAYFSQKELTDGKFDSANLYVKFFNDNQIKDTFQTKKAIYNLDVFTSFNSESELNEFINPDRKKFYFNLIISPSIH
jgi:hypothetical protein